MIEFFFNPFVGWLLGALFYAMMLADMFKKERNPL